MFYEENLAILQGKQTARTVTKQESWEFLTLDWQ